MNQSGFIKNIVIIAIILIVVFLSQNKQFSPIAQNLYKKADGIVRPYYLKSENWLRANIYSRFGGEVEKGLNEAKKEIVNQKDNLAENIWGKLKNYLAEKFSKISGTEVE